MWLASSSSIDSSSDLSSTAVLGDGPARLLLEEDKREKKPYIWALVSHSSRENRRSPFSPFAFLISCETCPGSSFLSDCSPISNLKVRYCLTFSEKRTAPPFGLWSAHPSLKLAWEGSLPCLLITLVLSSSEIVRDKNFSTQPRFSLSYPISVCCPTDLCSSISSTDLISRHMLVLGIPTLASIHCCFLHHPSHARFRALLSEWSQNSPVLLWDRWCLDASCKFHPTEWVCQGQLGMPSTLWAHLVDMKSRAWHWIAGISWYLNLSWFHLRGIQLRYILELAFLWAPCAYHWQWESRGPRYSISLWYLSKEIGFCRIRLFRLWLRKVVSRKWHTYTLSNITGGNNKLAIVITTGFIWF